MDRKSLPKDCLGYNFIKGGVVVGPCVGGNLPSMLDLFGTNYKPIIKQGTILLIEVVSTDSPEIIMDQFYKLKLTGAFDRISGLIVGKISAENILSDDNVLGEFLNNLLQDYNFPIVIGAMFTHLEPLYTMQFGSLIRIDSNNKTIKMVKRRDFCGK